MSIGYDVLRHSPLGDIGVDPGAIPPDAQEFAATEAAYFIAPEEKIKERAAEEVEAEFDRTVAEMDPDAHLWQACVDFAEQERQRLGTIPDSYLLDLYTGEILFQKAILTKLQKLCDNAELERVIVMFDLDRTTVALLEDGDNADNAYVTRPGMPYLFEQMATIAGDRLRVGVLSDRPQGPDDTHPNTPTLLYRVTEHFPSLPIDPEFVVSCTSGPLAESMPKHLGKRTEENLSPRAELQMESGQFDYIGGIACHSALQRQELRYHPKAGIVAKWLETHPEDGVLWVDDIRATRLIDSSRAQGVCADWEEGLQPLLADDYTKYLA